MLRELHRNVSIASFEGEAPIRQQIPLLLDMIKIVLIRASNLTFEDDAAPVLGTRRLLKKTTMLELDASLTVLLKNFNQLPVPPRMTESQTRWYINTGEVMNAVIVHIKRQELYAPVIDLTGD